MNGTSKLSHHWHWGISIAQLNYEINGTNKLSHHWHWGISLVGLAPLIATGNGGYLLGMNTDVGYLAFPDNNTILILPYNTTLIKSH